MLDLLAIIAPVFGLMAVGFLAGATGLVGERGSLGLADFVNNLAIPALVFKAMAGAALPDAQPWGYWAAYFSAVLVTWPLAMWSVRRFCGAGYGESVLAGLSASQSNTVMVGIPVLLRAYGEPGAVPLFLLIAIHLPVMLTAASILLEGAANVSPVSLVKKLVLNPILLSLMVGVAWRLGGLAIPAPVAAILDPIAATGIPCALIAMGLALRRYGIAAGLRPALLISACKLVVQPALTLFFAFKVFAMPPVWAGVAVLFAAMPSGINSYLFAERQGVGVAMTSSAIAVTTALSVFSCLFWLWVLGVAR